MRPFVGRRKRDIARREVYEEGLMGPFKREEVVDELPEKVRAFLAVQAQDGKLWFGDDLDYVRQQLRDLHCLLELPQ